MSKLSNAHVDSVVLLSGGMDSCVTLAHALAEGRNVGVLHVNYGQRTQQRELQAFNDIADHYGISKRLVVDISHLAAIGGSSLTDFSIEVGSSLKPEASSLKPNTYVPFRNGNILSIAASWAEVLGARFLYIGAVEEDSSGYPDCREEFFLAFEKGINLGIATGEKISIQTPLIHLTKGEIVLKGYELQAPLHLSWSCYKEQEIACGECDSCILRLKGFSVAEKVDPIRYRIGT